MAEGTPPPSPPHIAILGAGIIGLSTAYYLSLPSTAVPPPSIHLIDPAPRLFESASGKAGGFLGRDWFAPSVAALGKLSFEEHRNLAEAEGGREEWGYSPTRVWSYNRNRASDETRNRWWRDDGGKEIVGKAWGEATREPRWLRREAGDDLELVSGEGSTAQIDPRRLCKFLVKECLARGVQLHHPAKAISISLDEHDALAAVRIQATTTGEEMELPCTKLLFAAGPWTPSVFQTLFPSSQLHIPISGLAGYSLIVRSPLWVDDDGSSDSACSAVFPHYDDERYSPEIFARRGGEIFIAGLNDSKLALPDLASVSEQPLDDEVIQDLSRLARRVLASDAVSLPSMSGEGKDQLEVVRTGLCFRPVTATETPILSKIEDRNLGKVRTQSQGNGGVWICGGHAHWGISLSLGSGKVMAEMMRNERLSADVSGLKL